MEEPALNNDLSKIHIRLKDLTITIVDCITHITHPPLNFGLKMKYIFDIFVLNVYRNRNLADHQYVMN